MQNLQSLTRPASPLARALEWYRRWRAGAEARAEAAAAEQLVQYEMHLQALDAEFTDAQRIALRPYRSLSIGEAKMARTPAVEVSEHNGIVRLYHLLDQECMRRASLIKALAVPARELSSNGTTSNGETQHIGDLTILDVKPTDMAGIQHGVVHLGPAPEFQGAAGTRWRLYVELSYSGAAGSGRGGIQSRRFITDCTL
jgi:hypothetical protein